MSFDLRTARDASLRDLEATIDGLAALDGAGWATPVRCQGWVVADLAEHLVAAAQGQAEALRRAVAGRYEVVAFGTDVARTPGPLVEALRDGRAQLAEAFDALTSEVLAGPVPLPFGLLPAPVALQIVPIEYGFHRNDLEWALGSSEPLHADTAEALIQLLPGLLPILAGGSPVSAPGDAPAEPVAYRLVAPVGTVSLAFGESGWAVAAVAGEVCEVAGDDSAVALFALGRIPASHPSLKVSGRMEVAEQFKRFFPGP